MSNRLAFLKRLRNGSIAARPSARTNGQDFVFGRFDHPCAGVSDDALGRIDEQRSGS